MEALEKGSIYTAVIDGYSSEGLGIARVNGAVVFVPHAVRGEEVDLRDHQGDENLLRRRDRKDP